MSTTMSQTQMRQTVKANIAKLNAIDPTLNLKASAVSSMSSEALVGLIGLLESADAEQETNPTVAVAVEADSSITAKDGTLVPTVTATYLKRTGSGNFSFLAAGRVVIVDDSSLCAVAIAKGGELPAGYEVQLKPDSFEEIRVSSGDVIVKARINYAATAEVDKAAKFADESKIARRDYIAVAKMQGISGKEAADLYNEQIKEQLAAMVKPRSFTL